MTIVSRYQQEGVYPLFIRARPGRLIAEVEHHTYFQLPGNLPHMQRRI